MDLKVKVKKLSLRPLWLGLGVLFGMAGALAYFCAKYQSVKEENFAKQYSTFEEQRLVSHFNYRLNQLRDELLNFNIDQTVLSKALGDKEKEKILFHSKEALHAFGLIVYTDESGTTSKNKALQWQIQKQYFKDPLKPNQNSLLELYKEAASSIQPPGFFLKRTTGITGFDSYLLAFTNKDESGKIFAVVGLYSSSYVFPFCRFFTDSLGPKAVASFVMSGEDGTVLCHSNAKFEGTVFKESPAYQQSVTLIQKEQGEFEYVNASLVPVWATVRKVSNGNLYLVGEVEKNSSVWGLFSDWIQTEPRLLVALGACFFFLLGLSLFYQLSARKWQREMEALAETTIQKADMEALPEALPVITSPEAPPSNSQVELEGALLDMQSTMAFLVGFHQEAMALPLSESFPDFVVHYLSGDSLVTGWFEFEGEKFLRLKSYQGISNDKENFYKEYGFRFEVPGGFVKQDFDVQPLIQPMKSFLGVSRVILTPVYFGDKWIALLAVGGEDQDMDSRNLEILPYISQICASTSLIRDRVVT